MNIKLVATNIISPLGARVLQITGSKSETNRLLLLQALYPNLTIENTSNSDDSEVMAKALSTACQTELVEVHHAGTAMRFLTAFFAIQENREVVLTGSSRMKERPIKILVDALRQLGAEITYEENDDIESTIKKINTVLDINIDYKTDCESKIYIKINSKQSTFSKKILFDDKFWSL